VDDLLIKPAGANVLVRKSGQPDLFNNFVVTTIDSQNKAYQDVCGQR
jgi:hypothetical protein